MYPSVSLLTSSCLQVRSLYQLSLTPGVDVVRVWQTHMQASQHAGSGAGKTAAGQSVGDGGDGNFGSSGYGAEGPDVMDDVGMGPAFGPGDDDDTGDGLGDAGGFGDVAAAGAWDAAAGKEPAGTAYDPLSLAQLLPAPRKVARVEINYDRSAKMVSGPCSGQRVPILLCAVHSELLGAAPVNNACRSCQQHDPCRWLYRWTSGPSRTRWQQPSANWSRKRLVCWCRRTRHRSLTHPLHCPSKRWLIHGVLCSY